MPRVLLAAWGSAGDVAPFLAIGQELKRRGHDVTVIALPVFESAALRAGLSFRAVGSVEIFERLAHPDLWSHDRRLGADALAFLTRELPPVRVDAYYDAIRALHRPGETVVVTHTRATGAFLAYRDLGVPMAVVELAPSGLPGRSHPPIPLPDPLRRIGPLGRTLGRRYLELRQRAAKLLGASFAVDAADAATAAYVRRWRETHPEAPLDVHGRPPKRWLGAWPSWFAPAEAGFEVELVGFVFPPGSGPGEAAGGSADTAPRGSVADRPIVFTTGSVAGSQRGFFDAAIEACRRVDRTAVLVTRYADQLPRPLPPHAVHLEYAPFDELFSTAGVVVHHGGIGTIALGLAAGVPQVAKPMARDQFDNADRMEQLGVGRMIDGQGLGPERLARTLNELLTSAEVAERCAHWRSRTDRGAGAASAADAVEALSRPGEA